MSDAKLAKADVVLVGAGIMSATLGALLRRLEPGWSIALVERLDAVAAESSDPWNNAGTGHSALCELYYTPDRHGRVDIAKAVRVNEQFQVTRQFWAYAAETGMLTDVRSFLNPVPHVAFVQGAERVDYLRRRHHALAANPLFARTEFIDDTDEFARRLPLMAAERDLSKPVALSWADDGTDVDFGALTKQLVGFGLRTGMTAWFGHEVRQLSRRRDGGWMLKVRNRRTGAHRKLNAKFVFVGAGGHTLPLLQKAGIKEVKGFGGFPIGGRFLRSGNPALTAAHRAKVYGLPAPGAPAMTARTWTCGWSTASRGWRSGRSPVGRRNSSSMGASVTCPARSGRPTRPRCCASGLGSDTWSATCSANWRCRNARGLTRCGSSSPARSTPTGRRRSPASACR
ncbi:quinone oxidoreductase [Mycobacterium xenopi 3993]|nr:quinone oxidoreductase [Mycobacterium xenopi 3993]